MKVTNKTIRDLSPLTEVDKSHIAATAELLRQRRVPNPMISVILGIKANTISQWRLQNRVKAGVILDAWEKRATDSTEEIKPAKGVTLVSYPHTYLCGAITGRDPKAVAEDFRRAEERLKGYSLKTVNPLQNGLPTEADWLEHMRADISLLMQCQSLYIVNDILHSKGARIEVALAKALGIKCLHYHYSEEKIREVLNSDE